jgi:hypothetical protein
LDVIALELLPGGKYFNRTAAAEYFSGSGVGGSDPADGVFILTLTGRRVHINNQRLKAEFSQRHGRGNAYGSGTSDDDVIVQDNCSLVLLIMG